MLKTLLLVALVANIFLIVSSSDKKTKSEATSSATSSASSDSSKGAGEDCPGDKKSEPTASSSATSSSAASSSAASSSSANTGSNSDGADEDCPKAPTSCKGDPNAVPGCGVNCGKLCSNYNSSEPVVCALICYSDGCDCKSGYVLDEVTGKCVFPEQCTPQCTQPNEIYDPCPPTGPPQTCESLGRVYFYPVEEQCDQKCKGACRCKPRFYRNAIGECISEENCLKCSGPNEYYSCGGACDNVCATLSTQNQTNCPIVNIKCNEMCYCKDGYARDDSNICVPFDQCPEPCEGCKGDPNAHPGCGINCGRLCSNYDSPDEIACIQICEYPYGCDCNEGYVLDDNTGFCVQPEQCTPICGDNEEFSPCVQGPDCFPEDCQPGCVCKSPYRRDLNGTCVLIEEDCD